MEPSSPVYATGDVDGGHGSDNVGGLVGRNLGTIVASYATGAVDGNSGNDGVGGLVGWNAATIVASYATGAVDGGRGNSDAVGGLVGWNEVTIVASYATGAVDGGHGSDNVGGLVGRNITAGTTTASYGFGAALNGEIGVDRSADADPSIHSPAVLNAANSSTMTANQWDEDVWSFGDDRSHPVVNWVTGYDSGTGAFSCDPMLLPDGEACGDPIPGQYDSDGDGTQDSVPEAPALPTATSTDSTIIVTWTGARRRKLPQSLPIASTATRPSATARLGTAPSPKSPRARRFPIPTTTRKTARTITPSPR